MKDLITSYNANLKSTLDSVIKNTVENNFTFSTSELVPYTDKAPEKDCPAWQRLGWQFKNIPSPVLYWFEMNKDADPIRVFETARICKMAQSPSDPNFRHLPAMKGTGAADSHILYVGCCGSTSLMNRMFWHFGYYKTGKTQGLQLCHWSRGLNLLLTIHTLSFPVEAKDFIYVYEKIVANELRPIIGK